jgi:hypothetical protein
MKTNCEVCKRSPLTHNIALHRMNLGEVPARWRCDDHFHDKVDPEVRGILEAILEDNEKSES